MIRQILFWGFYSQSKLKLFFFKKCLKHSLEDKTGASIRWCQEKLQGFVFSYLTFINAIFYQWTIPLNTFHWTFNQNPYLLSSNSIRCVINIREYLIKEMLKEPSYKHRGDVIIVKLRQRYCLINFKVDCVVKLLEVQNYCEQIGDLRYEKSCRCLIVVVEKIYELFILFFFNG